MTFERVSDNLYRGTLDPRAGELATLWREHAVDVIVGHPTFKNVATIGRQLREGIAGAQASFPGRRVSFVVSDGTWTRASGDTSTLDHAQDAAAAALAGLSDDARGAVQCIVTPYEGYGDDRTPGKGSALKMIFDRQLFKSFKKFCTDKFFKLIPLTSHACFLLIGFLLFDPFF